jgi:hypothetical protein
MEKIKAVLLSTTAKRFYWQTLGGFLGLLVIYLTGLNWIYAPVLIAVIQGATKEINKYLTGPAMD